MFCGGFDWGLWKKETLTKYSDWMVQIDPDRCSRDLLEFMM